MKDKTTVLVSLAVAGFALAVVSRMFIRREPFAQQAVGMPLDGGGMGLYDGIDVSAGSMWSSDPAPTPLKPYEAADDNQLLDMQDDEFKPECCPSSITNDIGCLCADKKRLRQWYTRGGNRAV